MIDSLQRIRIVLVRTTHPGNIGAAARAMFTMGLTRLILVAPKYRPDHVEAVALAAGAAPVLERARCVATLDDALEGAALTIGLSARRREFVGRALGVRQAAIEAIASAEHGDVAIVFGTEMSGLTNDELARCAIAATIPRTQITHRSIWPPPVQVAAYELRIAATDASGWSAPRYPPATYDETEGLFGMRNER
jgi:tRNA/rRNA methyltransferase